MQKQKVFGGDGGGGGDGDPDKHRAPHGWITPAPSPPARTSTFFLLCRVKQPMVSISLLAEALDGPSRRSWTEGGSSEYS